ncbi:MAG: response regulator [Desmonostoc vinosum HA7617-LM4]|jgi:PAS domain S-box-containing protein|nr:response regulator [Desmonostoc vinosum HA7617-LM4]
MRQQQVEQLFAGEGEMAQLMRFHDWSQTLLGAVETWTPSLRSALTICLNSRFPIAIYWGSDFSLLYNDAWKPILGDKHPWGLGRPAREVWSEIWAGIGPELKGVLATGEGTFHSDELLAMYRFGYIEECYFDYTFNPIRGETGTVEGVINIVSETTYRVLNDRRAQLLREVASRTGTAKTAESAGASLVEALKTDPADIPFALLYLVDANSHVARLYGSTESGLDPAVCPAEIDLADTDPWLIALVARTGRSQIIDTVATRFGTLPGSPWAEPPQEAMVLPILAPGQSKITGVLVAVASPRRRLDDRYCDFFEQVAGQVALMVANAQAYEEERRRAEALAELDRAKTAFFSNVSHEFRTPLTLMLSPLQELSANLNGRLQPDEREQLQLVQRNGLRLQKLVNTLLDFSRIEAGRVQASYEPTDLASYTAELASAFRSLIESAGMTLAIDCVSLPELVYVDREMWEKIVLNLISNAFKFTFAGTITVGLQLVDNTVEFSVTDTGVGIPEAELPRLFERFHRVNGTRSRTYEGSGIGLALVQELVKLHTGTIRVNSQVARGTTFAIAIPLGTAHLPPERIRSIRTLESTALGAAPFVEEAWRWIGEADLRLEQTDLISDIPQTNGHNSQSKILLADDNADMRDYVKRLLSSRFQVETVANGAAALRAIQANPPDLVLSDVMMPEMDGFELLAVLRSHPTTALMPVILLSARAGEEARIEGLEAGADDYLTKPFSARELLARVESNLKLGQLRKATTEQEQALRLQVQVARDSLENVLTRIADQFLALDREWRYTYVNDRVTEVTGIARENLLGKSIWDVFPDTRESQFGQKLRRAVAEQTPVQFEYFYSPWNRWFENHVYPSADGVSIIVTEITGRKQAEQQLRESEKFLQAINETAPNLLYVFDLNERRNVYVSPQIFPLLGVLPKDVQAIDSQIFAQLFHPDDLEQIEQHHDRMRAAGEDDIFTIEYRMKHSSGRWLWLSSRDTIFVRDEQGKPRQILGSAIDITDRKQAELISAEQKRLLEMTASGTSLDECLAAICTAISQLDACVRACFLLSDDQCQRFSRSITPDLPPSFGAGLKDVPINELCIGTCGEAVYSGQPISCNDIINDDRWSQGWRELCIAHEILACHSTPVFGKDAVAIGSLMLCFKEVRNPTDWEYQLAEFGTQVASIVFERDRTNLALCKSEQKYRSLFESIDQGFCTIEVLFDTDEKPFDYRFIEVNEAFEQQSGLANAAGKTILELVPNLEPQWIELYAQVAKSGESLRFEANVIAMNSIFDVYALPIPASGENYVAILFADITQRKRREANLAFLSEIQDDCTRLTTANAMMQTIGVKIGAYLNLSICAFVDIDEAKDYAIVPYAWHRADALDVAGTYRISEFLNEAFYVEARAGNIVVVNDTSTDARADAASHAALNLYSFISVPFLRDGQWKFLLNVADSRPRQWREDEIELFSELANRIFPRLERARAEATVAADLQDMQRLRELSARLVSEGDTQTLYQEIVSTAIALTQADAGTMQIFDAATQELVLIATQGLEPEINEYFHRLDVTSNTSCGMALRTGGREFIDFDVPESEDPTGSMRRHVEAGILSAQTTPLIARSGKPLGMFSTHWRIHHRPSDRQLRFLDLLARQAADLIERWQTEADLRQKNAILNVISESTPTLIYAKDREGRILMANASLLDAVGLPESEVLGRTSRDFHQPREAAEQAMENDQEVMRSGQTLAFEEIVDTPTHRRTLLSIKSPYHDEVGNVIGLIGVSIDISDRKQIEVEREQLLQREQVAREQAETANRIKDEFLAVISHELRTPLNPILGWAKLLQQRKLDTARSLQALAAIERNAQLQSQLIDDLLDISRILRGKLSFNTFPVNLSQVIAAAQETVRLAAEAKSIQIQTEIASIGQIKGDAGRLQQVVWNLLSNAVKFTPQGGQIIIALTQTPTHAQLQVSDTGKGIHPDFLPYVFEHFRQEDSATTRKFGGLGLGLAIAKQITELHGGTIAAESAGEGQGATFTVEIPLAFAIGTSPTPTPTSMTTSDLSNLEILVIDDDADSREIISFILELAGAIVTSVASGKEALQAIKKSIPDVIVSDIGMAEMDGYMFMQQIRQLESVRQVPAIALSAYAGDCDRQQALKAGFQQHLAKPIDPEALTEMISVLVNTPKPTK